MKETYTWSAEIRTITSSVLVVFVILKLTGEVTWPWLWVLSPFWIPALISSALILIFFALRAVLRAKR